MRESEVDQSGMGAMEGTEKEKKASKAYMEHVICSPLNE